ncbi:putative secreted protein [Neorhizobium sp. R1-B]|nr:putative secreted protein [Neorhizobium sp. S3-V5DH]TDX74134.1 putative secreted protein [Neorhizobium sp. R1-B]
MMSSLRYSLLACAAMFFADTTSAADIASIQPIGFSADGHTFAYEEYGIHDGSGFPYANIYVLDLTNDTFLPGTPFRVRLEQDDATIAKARWRVRNDAGAVIESHELANHPAEFVAFNPATEVDADPHRLRYLSVAALPAIGKPNTLVLEELPQPLDPRCEGLISRTVAFRLRFTERDGMPADEIVHEDRHIPLSRNCVGGYRLGGIVSGSSGGSTPVEVALVMVLSAGFEGQDGRWIAIPLNTPR